MFADVVHLRQCLVYVWVDDMAGNRRIAIYGGYYTSGEGGELQGHLFERLKAKGLLFQSSVFFGFTLFLTLHASSDGGGSGV